MFKLFLTPIVHNALASYRGYRILFHLLAALITAGLVMSGIDWWFFTATRSEYLRPLVYGAGIGGFFLPVLVPLLMYVHAAIKKSARLRLASAAAAQSVILAWCISSLYKAFTGRIEPEFYAHLEMVDRSRIFNFGFFEYGIFWGWPSSHTAVAFALAAAIAVFYSQSVGVRLLAFGYAVFIAIGAAIGFHWFSDVVAGAIVGSVVGLTVGRYFLSRVPR